MYVEFFRTLSVTDAARAFADVVNRAFYRNETTVTYRSRALLSVRRMIDGSVIDTSVLIAAERGVFDLAGSLTSLGETPIALSTDTASEVLHGVYSSKVLPREQSDRITSNPTSRIFRLAIWTSRSAHLRQHLDITSHDEVRIRAGLHVSSHSLHFSRTLAACLIRPQ